jgi:hypothetical protein
LVSIIDPYFLATAFLPPVWPLNVRVSANSNHVFRDIDRNVLLAVMHGDGQPDEIGKYCRATGPRLDRALVVGGARCIDPLKQVSVNERTLLD